jgi:feruloyl-CoA synthase
MVDYLEQWARQTPETVFLAERGADGGWSELTYREAWRRVQGVAQALVNLGLNQATPIAILSGASIEHGVLTFAGMLAGVPVSPISPSYSLLAAALPRLAEVAEVLAPALVFAQSAISFTNARSAATLAAAWWMSATPAETGTILISELYDTPVTPTLCAARASVTPDAVAKILFTSGSTGSPKGVLNTQRMICSAAAASALVVESEATPVVLDWLPWHHTMGGNSTLHGVLRAGGSLYLDNGRPTPLDFEKTIENIRSIRPTSLLSVPAALQMLATAMEGDDELRIAFFSRLSRLAFAGASLPQDVRDRIQMLAVRTTGVEVPFGAGYGTTETAPGISATHWPSRGGGEIGLPFPGLLLKLVPVEGGYDVRVRGPNVMPGYLGRPDLTAAAFDEEGFYKVGDWVQFVDATKPARGLRFIGRLSENFKLTNGSWVATGELRSAVVEACRPLVSDLAIAGHDRDDIRLLIWINPADRRRAGGATEGPLDRVCYDTLAAELRDRLTLYNLGSSSATHRIAAFRILHEPPSLGAGEATDKGYVNQRGVLQHRAPLVEELYANSAGHEVWRV